VQFVENQVLQGTGFVKAPQPLVLGPQQQKVQHFVVGQQHVGGRVELGGVVGDAVVGPHLGVARILGAGVGGVVAPGVGADANARIFELGVLPDGFGEALFLVGGQGIHGVKHDGFDAGLPGLLGPKAVVEHGVQKALGFAGAGASGDQGGFGLVAVAVEPSPGPRLVAKGGEGDGDIEGGCVVFGQAEGAFELYPGAFEDALLGVFKEALKGLGHFPVTEVEGGLQVVEDLATDVVGEVGWEHGAKLWSIYLGYSQICLLVRVPRVSKEFNFTNSYL